MRHFKWTLALAVLAAQCLVAAWAQEYPSHPVKIVVGYAAGGSPDQSWK